MRRRRFLLPALGALLSFGPALVQVPDEADGRDVEVEAGLRGGFIYLLNLRLRPGTGREGRSEFFKIGGTRAGHRSFGRSGFGDQMFHGGVGAKDMQQRLPAYVTAQPFYPEVISEVPVPDWRASESRLLRAFPRGSDMDGGEDRGAEARVRKEGYDFAVEVAKMLLELGAELRRVVVVVDGPTDLQRSGALWLEARRSQGLAVQEEFRDYDLPFCKAGSAQLSSFLKVPAGRTGELTRYILDDSFLPAKKILQQDMTTLNCGAMVEVDQRASRCQGLEETASGCCHLRLQPGMEKYSLKNVYAFYSRSCTTCLRCEGTSYKHFDQKVYVILDNRTAPPADMIFMAMDAKCSHLRVAQALKLVLGPELEALRLVGQPILGKDHGLVVIPRPLPTAWPQDIRELFVEGTELTLEQLGQVKATPTCLKTIRRWVFPSGDGSTSSAVLHVKGTTMLQLRPALLSEPVDLRHIQLQELGVGVPDTKSTARRKDEAPAEFHFLEWDHRYGQLLAYRAREGDCDVESLLKWLRRLLEDLSYDNRTLEQRWKDNFAGLRSFVKREGHADVPAKHVEGEVKLGRQKLTKEARAVAFHHCTEIDAACCHPRLLQQKLMDLDVWSDAKYVMLSRFIKNYKSWHQCAADYMNITLEDAKVELIRLFYGGNLSCDIPFLVKLCTEIQDAARATVQHESSRRWQQLYSERRSPQFSRLSGTLSMDEASMLASVSSLMGKSMCVLLFDGGYIRCRDLHDDISLFHALEADDSRVGTQIRRWGPLHIDECDLGELSESELHDGFSARDFNLSSMHLSQRDDDAVYALKWLPDGFSSQDAQNGAVCVFHEKGTSEASECLLGVQTTQFQDVLEDIEGTTAFLLTLTTSTDPLDMPPGSAYDLRGRDPSADEDDVLFVSTPVRTCVECGAPLAPALAVSGRVYTLQGMKQVEVTTKRCSRKAAVYTNHHYNYRKVHGQNYHSLSLQDLEYVFVNSKVGFERTFLDYHDALQFRGVISHNAIEFAQSQVLWEDADQHYRWHHEYASAQLYYSVVLESNEMWAHSTDDMRKRRHC
ncbi:hypothetical protein AK812_SmicGene1850 [Symbiodinium microadriaticum]|uniref:Uncharacterized protein n=1 Tax=Symbiodinium microadriaticum TaxID=2951 RepID=A0A1Q9F343_SYMMI|nr:hypothetical protein AK812_SmicGene1850 [Symbiodinium microadriaticum]